jgi:hypothetical protein
MIEFKTPSEKDVESMRGFAEIMDKAFVFLMDKDLGHVAQQVMIKINEAMMWVNQGVLNRPEPAAAPQVAPAPAEAEPEKIAV